MCKKLIYLISFVLVLGLANSAVADLVGYWPFEEGSGTTAADATGNGNDGTLNSGVEWVQGHLGTAVHFDTAGERVVIGPLDPTAANNAMTLAAWINWEGQGNSIEHQGIFGKRLGWDPGTGVKWFWETTPAGDLVFRADNAGGGGAFGWGNGLINSYPNEWIHVAATWDDGAGVQYINGEEVATGNVTFRDTADDTPVTIGCVDSTNNETFVGSIDDARIYDTALTAEDIVELFEWKGGPPVKAAKPSPADGATDVTWDVVMSWKPGEFADTHNVYFGDNFDDVNNADITNPLDVLVGPGQDANTFDPDGLLEFEKTYYWRIDEVNAPPDSTIFKGNVWSFTVEPFVYPIENVTATSSSSSLNMEPEKTVDGSGLNTSDQHSTDAMDMWLSNFAGPQPTWIQYEFDRAYKVYEMWVWNSNQSVEAFVGFGAKDVTIEHSEDGAAWTALGDVELARATGRADYAHNTTVDFGGVLAKYVRINVHSDWGGITNQYGLSEVRFFYIPVYAREPNPASGATDVALDLDLSWRAGREAASHDVYLSTDEQAVIDGTAAAVTVTGASYSSTLDLASTYYWRIDEVNEAASPSSWEGDVWNFSTIEYFVVDDFEDYNDYPPDEIFSTWIDGWEVPTNGSMAGHADPPFAETTIVHSGSQSMPLLYSNTSGAIYSEAERTFAVPQDWTKYGIQTLGLWFHGTEGNTGQLYVKINGSMIPYDGQAGNIARAVWRPWNIDLTASGLNLQSVSSLAIGIDGNGAGGTLYFDDVRLYGQAAAPIEPALLVVPKTSVAPIIDGQWDAGWNDVNETRCLITDMINTNSETPEDAADLSAIFKAFYDDNNFYIFVEVQDSVIDYEFSDWQGDGVEIYFDGDNSKGSSYDNVNDNQIRITVDDVELADIDSSLPVDGAVFKVVLTDLGYNIEASFPLEALQIYPSEDPDNIIGFEVQINDNDSAGGRQTLMRWHSDDNDSWQNPSLFGEAQLVSSTVGN